MMKKEVLTRAKRNNVFIILVIIIFSSCVNKKNISIDTVNKLEPTYIINNSLVLDALNRIEIKKETFDTTDDIIVLYVKKNQDKSYELSLTKTEFSLFRVYKSDYYFKTLKGYANYKDKKVLLYGDIENSLFVRTNEKLQNIMYYDVSKNESTIPMIYEPSFFDFIIQNNKLIEK